MHNTLRFFTLLLMVVMAGCGTSVPTVKPYKMDIQQGNVVTSEMLLKLRPGMTKSQVQFIMGTPLLVDSFHSNRWDYFYQLRKQGEIVNQRRVILDFDGDALARVRGDVVPEGTDIDALMKQAGTEDKGSEGEASQPIKAEANKTEPMIEVIESPAIDTVESEKAKLQAAKAEETTKVEAMKQQEAEMAAKEEAMRLKAAKAEEAAKAEAMKLEAAKAEEAAKVEAMKQQEAEMAAKEETMRLKAAKAEEAAKAEAMKLEATEATVPPVVAVEPKKAEAKKVEVKRTMIPAPPQVSSSSGTIARPGNARIPAPPMIGKPANSSSPTRAQPAGNEEEPGMFERTLEMIGF